MILRNPCCLAEISISRQTGRCQPVMCLRHWPEYYGADLLDNGPVVSLLSCGAIAGVAAASGPETGDQQMPIVEQERCAAAVPRVEGVNVCVYRCGAGCDVSCNLCNIARFVSPLASTGSEICMEQPC